MFYNIKKILKNIWYVKSLLYLCGVKGKEFPKSHKYLSFYY